MIKRLTRESVDAVRKRTLLATAASVASFVPAPPIVNIVYGPIDPNTNGGGEMVGAYADPATNTIYLPNDPSPYARAHETGHLFDAQVLGDGDRIYFQKLMQAPAGPWDHGKAYGKVEGNISPNEWFSDYYAAAATGRTPQNGYGGESFATIGPKRMIRFEKALARLGKRRSLQQYK